MRNTVRTILGAGALALATQASAQVTFYEGEGFQGRSFNTDRSVNDFAQFGFNDRASSVIIDKGRWEVCEDARFSGQCVVLRRGRYDSLRAMGLDNSVSSVRATNRKVAVSASPPPVYYAQPDQYRRQGSERVYQAQVTSVRAVVGPPEQRCWVEREQVQGSGSGSVNIPGAVIGAVIGGVLGHQVGGGRGQDVATGVGAVGGAAVGANVGRGGSAYTRDVQKCTNVASTNPDYWDVTYNYRGTEHRVQMTTPPGSTIEVNGNGEPRT